MSILILGLAFAVGYIVANIVLDRNVAKEGKVFAVVLGILVVAMLTAIEAKL